MTKMRGCERTVSNLDNLVTKIIKDSEEKSRQIIETANLKAYEIIQEYINQANKEAEQILADAKDEAKKASEQIILGKKLEIRDDNIGAKQEMIDAVFDRALKELNSMSKNDFFKFLSKHLAKLDLDGEEIILPYKYEISDIDELNSYLKEKGKKGNLKLHSGERKISGGFILVKNGIENNSTFEALINYYRYELESKIIKTIF